VHHSSTDFTLANAARLSPVEALYQPLVHVGAPLLGFPIAVYAPALIHDMRAAPRGTAISGVASGPPRQPLNARA
jgi:hypothetical protein